MNQAPMTYLNERGEQVVSVGISATREGLSQTQLQFLASILKGKCGEFHHGDCVGGDTDAHNLVRTQFRDKWRIIIHPPIKNEFRAFNVGDEVRPVKPYLPRNRDIVQACNVFLGFPKGDTQKGGTWWTINYFQQVISLEYGTPANPRVGSIILPNGDMGNIVVESKLHSQLQ